MKAIVPLRVAALIAAIQGTAHGTMLLTAIPRHGPTEWAIVQAMRTNHFDFAGASRSYWDFYMGYGLEAACACLLEAVLFLQLSKFAAAQPDLVRRIGMIFVIGNIGHIALAAEYFFYLPVVFDVLIIANLLWAVLVVTRTPRSAQIALKP